MMTETDNHNSNHPRSHPSTATTDAVHAAPEAADSRKPPSPHIIINNNNNNNNNNEDNRIITSPPAAAAPSAESHNAGEPATTTTTTSDLPPQDFSSVATTRTRMMMDQLAAIRKEDHEVENKVQEEDPLQDEDQNFLVVTTKQQTAEQAQKEHDNRGSVHFGDDDFEVESEVGEATWSEVCDACCDHTPREWGILCMGLGAVAVLLYFFLFGLDLLGSGAKVMSGCKAGELFGDDSNPVAGLMIGILATVLLQSSSTTTSIIVSLVGDDSGTISVSQGIYMVMGANIGTSVTNTIVAMGQVGDGDQLERAFAGATVHDMFNFMSVAILMPLEVITGYLDKLTAAMVKNASVKDGEKWEGPVKKIVSPLSKRLVIPNKKVTKGVANGEDCHAFYPMDCGGGTPTYKSCNGKFGLIACDKDNNFCPAFFDQDATVQDDKVSGGVCFFIAMLILFTCLLGIVAILQTMLLGMSARIVYKATDVNGYVSMAIGAGITMLVQSSSITTSTLTPLVGMGAIRLEQMYPLTLGANIGTTVTGMTAALVSSSIDSLQVALAHLFFNISGILLFYPIPFMRGIPIYAARRLGKATRVWRGFPIVYIVVMFVVVPLFFLGLSALFDRDTKGFTVLGSFIVIILFCVLTYITVWCIYMDGQAKCYTCMVRRERKRAAFAELPDDMEFLKANMGYLKKRVELLTDHVALEVDDEDEEDDALINNHDEESSGDESDGW